MILLPVRLLSAAIFINLLINMFIVFSGFYPSRDFVNLSNLHNILIIPFFISTMYTYKVFIAVTSSMLVGSSHKLRGILNFIMFVFCKSTFGFVNILIDTGFVPCIPGLSSVWLGILLVTMIQLVGVSIIALVIPRLYARDWNKVKVNTVHEEKGEVVEKCNLFKVDEA